MRIFTGVLCAFSFIAAASAQTPPGEPKHTEHPGEVALIQSGNCARHLGDPAGAAAEFERAAKLRPDSWVPAYNLGCLAVVTGHPQAGIAHLAAAVTKGLRDPARLRGDADWESVRHDPGFERIARELEKAGAAPDADELE